MKLVRWIWMVGWLVLADPTAARTTQAPTEGDPVKGKPLYEENCMKCHGPTGDGKGRAARNLEPKPQDLRTVKFDEDLWFRITKLGSKAVGKSNNMEGYGKILTDDQIRDVLAYVKTLRK